MKCKTIINYVAAGLIILFVYDAAGKLIDFQNFRIRLTKSPLFAVLAWRMAFLMPLLELLVAGLLLHPAWRLAGLAGALLLMSVFTIYLVSMLGSYSHQPCACGEVFPLLTLGAHLLFNLLVVLCTGVTIILSGRIRNRAPGYI
jgi:hypothetical protein